MYNITLIPGDGIGPEVTNCAKKILDHLDIDIHWDIVNAGSEVYKQTGELVPMQVYESIEKNKLALKGPITTPIGSGFQSINVSLRKKYDLFSNIRPIKSIGHISKNFSDVDLVIFRENTEGLYVGIEEEISVDEYHATKVITRASSYRIIKEAFEFAKKNNRKKVTLVHKANILKKTDGLFLNIGKELSLNYKDIIFEDIIVDNMCMQLVLNPQQFDVIVTMNLYGDILSDLCAGLVGGLGLIPGANIGTDTAIFEAVHGSAPDIAGKNIANPTAIILSSAMLLEYIGELKLALLVRQAVYNVISNAICITPDLGGNSTSAEFTETIISEIDRLRIDTKYI